MNKDQRDAAIEIECRERAKKKFGSYSLLSSKDRTAYNNSFVDCCACTKSLANLTYIVGRAVEMAREKEYYVKNIMSSGQYVDKYSPEEIISEIAKELGIS